MMSVEERIKQVFEKERKSRNLLSNPTVESAVSLMYSRIEKEVLQILAEHKIIPMEKWGELLKLWEIRPFTDFMPLDNISPECKECINNVLEWYRKIEEKLKELQK